MQILSTMVYGNKADRCCCTLSPVSTPHWLQTMCPVPSSRSLSHTETQPACCRLRPGGSRHTASSVCSVASLVRGEASWLPSVCSVVPRA